jgi:hypothetical protein
MIVVGRASARVLLSTPDRERARAHSLANLIYDSGGDLGFAYVVPYAADHGADFTLRRLGPPLIALGLVLAVTRGLPRIGRTSVQKLDKK